jgi:nicotinamide-nucleotide amidase
MSGDISSDRSGAVSAMLEADHGGGIDEIAAAVIAGLGAREWTVGTAESISGGAVCAALTAVPGASSVVLGSVVSYATHIKAHLLNVDADLLSRRGAVDPDVALQMAHGVRDLLGADCAIATTGSAGPDPAPGGTDVDNVDPGRVFLAVITPDASWAEQLDFRGDRAEIRAATVRSALHGLDRTLRQAT